MGHLSPPRPVRVKKINKLEHNQLKKPTATNDGQVEQPKKTIKYHDENKADGAVNQNLKPRRD